MINRSRDSSITMNDRTEQSLFRGAKGRVQTVRSCGSARQWTGVARWANALMRANPFVAWMREVGHSYRPRGMSDSTRESPSRTARTSDRAEAFEHVIVIDAICVVRWGENPDAEVVRKVTARLLEARRLRHRSLALVVISHPSMKEPVQSARDEFIHSGPSFARALACAYAVVRPDAEHRQVQIGFLEAMKAFNPVPSDICDSLEDALRRASIAVGADAESVIEEARRRGLFES